MSDWYTVVEGKELRQGDIICQRGIPQITDCFDDLSEGAEIPTEMVRTDMIILSQSCDLEQDKISDVIVAEVVDWTTAHKELAQKWGDRVKSTSFRKELVQGRLPSLSLLHKRQEEPTIDWSLVNFHKLFMLPKLQLQQYALEAGPRLRLNPPYREHLAQAFARYFMRVGLPHDAHDFIEEGKVT